MIKLTAKKRLAIFLSCVWIFLWTSFLAIETSKGFDFEWGVFLFLVISPIFFSWGIYWVISGFKRDPKTAISKKTYGFFSNAANKASPESELFISSRISQPKSEPLSTTAQNEKPKLLNQEEHEKPKFKNREEYEKWKAEKIRNLGAKQNQDKYDKCKYNFDQPNLNLIRSNKRKNRLYICIMGLCMISIGTIILVPATEALFRAIAEILGALTGTYLLTRAIIKSEAKRGISPTQAALSAFFVVAALALIITTITMGVGKGFILYIPWLVLWLIIDLVRAKVSKKKCVL